MLNFSIMKLGGKNKAFFSTTKNSSRRPCRVTIFGPPGGGKGTQCAKLTKDYGLKVFSTGDELRRMAGLKTELAKKIASVISTGALVDSSLMIKMMDELLVASKLDSFIVDGFPRSEEQAELFDDLLAKNNIPLDLAIMIDTPHDAIVERISGRRVHLPSGRVYNISYDPPKVEGIDDETGEPLTQREDDNEVTVRKRLQQYQEKTFPLLEYYHKKGILVTIPSPTSDEGYIHIKELFNKYFSE